MQRGKHAPGLRRECRRWQKFTLEAPSPHVWKPWSPLLWAPGPAALSALLPALFLLPRGPALSHLLPNVLCFYCLPLTQTQGLDSHSEVITKFLVTEGTIMTCFQSSKRD